MQNYELTVLVKNTLDEKQRRALLDSLVKQLGELQKEDLWGNRGLAYPIQHLTAAFYAHFEFAQEQNQISALDKNLKLNEDIIRFLLTKKEDKKIRKSKTKVQKIAVEEKKEEEIAGS